MDIKSVLKKRVLIGLGAFLGLNAIIYWGAYDIPKWQGEKMGAVLSEQCRGGLSWPDYHFRGDKKVIEKEVKEIASTLQARIPKQCDWNCFEELYIASSTLDKPTKITVLTSVQLLMFYQSAKAKNDATFAKHVAGCVEELDEVLDSNQLLVMYDWQSRNGMGWNGVFTPFDWYFRTFLKW